MPINKKISACLFAFPVASVSVAQAQEQQAASTSTNTVNVSVALRAFYNKTTQTGFQASPVPGLRPFGVTTSDNGLTWIPSVGVRYGRWMATASYFTSTEYRVFVPEINQDAVFDRREWDVNVGYAILPNVVATVGYKEIRGKPIEAVGGLSQKYRGPTVGVAASAPVAQNVSLYGNLAYGRLNRTVGGDDFPDANYVSGEFGLQFSLRQWLPAVGGASLIIGYRFQSAVTKDAPTGVIVATQTTAVLQNSRRTLRDSNDGVVIGLNYVF